MKKRSSLLIERLPKGQSSASSVKLGAFLLALAFAACPASAQPSAEAARQALRDGERLWRLKRTRSALQAFELAAQAKETAAEARVGLGRIYFFKGWEAEGAFPGWHEEVEYREKALPAFDGALEQEPSSQEARLWRWRALNGLGRDAGPEPVLAAPADSLAAERIQTLRAEKKSAELIEAARAFALRFPESERLPAVYDALIEAYRSAPSTPVETIGAAIAARIAARPDPGAYVAGANLLLGRGALEQARKLAEELVPAAETFVAENLGSYKLAEKARGSLNRTRATSADLVGWALFLGGDAAAEAKLSEAERLSRGQDFANQLHVAELLRKKGRLEEAHERYLNALSLSGGSEAQRTAARQALLELKSHPVGFETWLKGELDRRREERRAQALGSMLDRAVPKLPLASFSGEPIDVSKLRGKLLLYKFFASW